MASTYIPHLPNGVPLTNIAEPENIDVLCGRDGYVQRHVGNQSYRKLVNANKEAYTTCKKTDKLKISRCIVAAVRERGGRFLEKPKGETTWSDIGDKKAVEKTSQALREGQPKLRRQIVEIGAGSTTSCETITFQFTRTPEYEVSSTNTTTSNNTARISFGTPLPTIIASPIVDERPSIDTGTDQFQQFDAAIDGSPLLSQGESNHVIYSYSTQQPYCEVPNNIDSISEDNPYSMPDRSYQYQHHQQFMEESVPNEMVDQPYAMSSAAFSPADMPLPFSQQEPANELHRQVTHQHDNYSSRDLNHFQSYDSGLVPVDSLDQQQHDPIERQQVEHHMFQQPHDQQIFECQRETFASPARSRSSDSIMSSFSSIGPGRIPSDWVAPSNSTTGNGVSLLPPSRKLDRRRMFARMKGSQLSSAKLSEGSRQSIDGMPDIHMVNSSFSLLTVGSNSNNRMGPPTAATSAYAIGATAPVSKDDFFVMSWMGSSRRSITSSGRLSFTTKSRDDLYAAMGSRRSLMSGLSNISGAADSNFSDVGRKIGPNMSNRSMALSEISSCFEEGNLEGLADWELKNGDEASAI
jgi:hypothetical protein